MTLLSALQPANVRAYPPSPSFMPGALLTRSLSRFPQSPLRAHTPAPPPTISQIPEKIYPPTLQRLAPPTLPRTDRDCAHKPGRAPCRWGRTFFQDPRPDESTKGPQPCACPHSTTRSPLPSPPPLPPVASPKWPVPLFLPNSWTTSSTPPTPPCRSAKCTASPSPTSPGSSPPTPTARPPPGSRPSTPPAPPRSSPAPASSPTPPSAPSPSRPCSPPPTSTTSPPPAIRASPPSNPATSKPPAKPRLASPRAPARRWPPSCAFPAPRGRCRVPEAAGVSLLQSHPLLPPPPVASGQSLLLPIPSSPMPDP